VIQDVLDQFAALPPRAVTIHWLKDGLAACDGPLERATPAMGAVTCSVCRTLIDITLELVGLEPEDPAETGTSFDLSDAS
jgi:hypothetical protein